MNPTLRVKHEESRTVGAFDVTVTFMEEMNYSGTWEDAGCHVFLGMKKIGYFFGYPIESDIRSLINREFRLTK